jgi:tRNA(adenine34) deaminase
MVDSIQYFMQAALDIARAGLEKGELPMGAVVVVNDQIIAAAHTQEKSQRRLLVHAELLALETADRLNPFPGKRRDAKLFATGEPCLMCLGAAMSFFVGEIYYGHECPSDGAVALVQQWRRKKEDFPSYRVPKIVGGILRHQALALFREYVERYPSSATWEWAKTIAALDTR